MLTQLAIINAASALAAVLWVLAEHADFGPPGTAIVLAVTAVLAVLAAVEARLRGGAGDGAGHGQA